MRMVAEVPALDDRVKAVMEAEAALEAQSAQGIVRSLVSHNMTLHPEGCTYVAQDTLSANVYLYLVEGSGREI